MNKFAYLIFDARSAEIRRRTGLTSPDPFIYLQPSGQQPIVYFNALEYSAQKEKLAALKNGVAIKIITASPLQALLKILKDKKISTLKVSPTLPLATAEFLKENNLSLSIYDFTKEHEHKTAEEIGSLADAQHVTEDAFALAYGVLMKSEIKKNSIYYKGVPLTSELMKKFINKHLLDRGFSCPEGIIISCGKQAAQPHNEGTGQLLPHQTIIIDIFPRSDESGYFGDMTRTFVKGHASSEIKDLYKAVERAQKMALEEIQIGAKCSALHRKVVTIFRSFGYRTTNQQGFIHGTGHSLGLNIHEEPRLNSFSERIIEPGMVFTVEPGLYYPKIGGVRLEDIIAFSPSGEKKYLNNFNRPFIIP